MTGMMRAGDTQKLARLFVTPPLFDMADCAAAAVGLADARRFGVRARLFLRHHPRLQGLVTRLFGFATENGLADDRLESIRSFAVAEALGGRSASARDIVLRWSELPQ